MFVEFGTHFHKDDSGNSVPQIRYADGRQALCLNDDSHGNVGAQISQSISTVAGRNYVLSFAQADESMGAGSPSQVTVRLDGDHSLGSRRTFSRTNDPSGYTVKHWQFTADGSSVLLRFTDTTTNALPGFSPFLDAISVVPGSVLVAGSNSTVPNGTGTFGQLPRGPGVWNSNIVFFGAAAGGQQGIYGINDWPGDPVHPVDPIKIADLNTPIPGGSGNFTGFTGTGGHPGDPMISGKNVVFWGMGANGQQGIYAFPADPIFPTDPMKIADLNTPVPGGNLGNFTGFTPNSEWPTDPMISGNRIAFFAGSAGGQGIYSATLDGAITTIADRTMHAPGTVNKHFTIFDFTQPNPSISGKDVAFAAYSDDGSGDNNTDGVYLSSDGVISRVADTTITLPGGAGYSYGFHAYPAIDSSPGVPQVSSGNVLFWAAASVGRQGLFVKYPQDPIFPVDPMRVVADTQTPIPGGSGNFTGFSAMSLGGDAVAFVGLGDSGQQGIYISHPIDPIFPTDPMYKVLDLNDTLDGKTITGLNLSRTGLDRDHNLLAFGATFSDGTQGLYTLNVFTGLRITSVAKAGADLQLSFTSQVGHNYTLQSFASVVNGRVTDLITGIPGTGGSTQTTVSSAFLQPQQFYRILQE